MSARTLSRSSFRARWASALAAALLPAIAQTASAQFFNVGGVAIDARGVLREASALSADERLGRLRSEAVGEAPAEIAAGNSLRKVSLRRLEALVAELHASGRPLPADVRHLAGLTAVKYVFFDPESADVILAGPAEGWTVAASGEVVGARSGRPVLHLDDLIATLRFAFAGHAASDPDAASVRVTHPGFIGCSIDPTEEGLRNYAAFMRRLNGIDRARAPQILAGMEQAMGPHEIRLFGIDESSRAALVLAAADYRLKRLALGHDPSPVPGVVNYLDLSARKFNRRAVQRQHRWWFLAHYDAVHHTPDELAFELDGQGVKVVTARTFPGSASGGADDEPPSPAAVEFADSFTEHFAALAEKVPVFLELQNLVGLATAAELIAQKVTAQKVTRTLPASRVRQGFAQTHHAGSAPPTDGSNAAAELQFGDHGTGASAQSLDAPYEPSHFLDPEACPVARHPVPKHVPSLANYRLAQGRHWIISVSGGVEIDPRDLAGRRFRREATDRRLAELRVRHGASAERHWWWD